MKQPGKRKGDSEGKQGCQEIAKMERLEVFQHKFHMDEVELKAHTAYKREGPAHKGRRNGKETTHDKGETDTKRNICHALEEERETVAQSTLEIDTHPRTEHKRQHHGNPTLGFGSATLLYPSSDIDSDEEYGNAAYKDFYVAQTEVKAVVVAHQHTKQHCHYRQPTPRSRTADKCHISRGNGVECHNGWYVPEMELVIDCPEVVVEQNVENGVGQRLLAFNEEGYEIEAGYEEPSGIDTDIASPVKLFETGILCPCEP